MNLGNTMSPSAFATLVQDPKIVDTTEHVSVSVVNDLRDVEALRAEWSALQWHPNSDIDFYINVVRSWSDRCKPYILAIRRGGTVEAILVGRDETVQIDCAFGYKSLFRVGARQLTFIYGGMLGQYSPKTCMAILSAIRATLDRGERDLVEFHFIRDDSTLYPMLVGKKQSTLHAQAHYSTELGTEDTRDVYCRMSAKRRNALRSQQKKLMRDFREEVWIHGYRHPEEISNALIDVESIASRTYHRSLGFGYDGSEELRQRLIAEAERGRLRVYLLYLASRPIAFWIATAYKGVLYSDFMGYDPELAKYSPGMYLTVKTLEGMSRSEVDQAIWKIDWGLGDAQYKQVLGTDKWTEDQVRLFGRTPRGFLLRLTVVPMDVLSAQLKRVLARSGMLQRIKTKWRQRRMGVEAQAPPSVQ